MLLATIALAAVVGFSTAAAAGAAPARSAKLTAAEQKWATPVVQIWNLMNDGLRKVVAQANAKDALVPGTNTNKALVITLGNFVSCSPALKKIGPPPTARLKPFAASMTSGCALLGKGSHQIANGISTIYKLHNGKLGGLQVRAGIKTLGSGSSKLALALKQIQAVGK